MRKDISEDEFHSIDFSITPSENAKSETMKKMVRENFYFASANAEVADINDIPWEEVQPNGEIL